jgi:hypothetical protein
MKSIKQIFYTGLASMLILSSCSIEKRVYMPGYHIEWANSKHNSDKQELGSKSIEKKTEQNQIATVEQSENENKTVGNSLSVNEENITASLDKTVIIPNHQKISLSKKENTITAQTTPSSETKTVISKKVAQTKKKTAKKNSAAGGSSKSQMIALILCIFLGWLGIHRFYLGYTGAGILYLLTGGLFGIGWLIDIVLLILPNGLTPKGKSNYK